MRLVYSERFLKGLRAAPEDVQKAFLKQSELLLRDLQHPSLRAKKYDESRGIWQGRVNRAWRFYFSIEDDTYRMHAITPHPK
jgi:mRNA-degrading endonuclease RelE of RelBE toxin-antitoxin system